MSESSPQERPELTPERLKVLMEDIPKALAEETHDPWTGEPKCAARERNMEADLALQHVIVAAVRALREIAEYGDSLNGYWHRSRALLALAEMEEG